MPETLKPFGGVDAHVMWRETNTRLDTLAGRVREGVDVLAASEFARWLTWSGVLELLESHEAGYPLPCQGAELRKKVTALIADCGEWFKDHEHANTKPHPQVPKSELESIHEQLRAINDTLATLSAVPKNGAVCPDLCVINGGVASDVAPSVGGPPEAGHPGGAILDSVHQLMPQ